MPWRVRLQPEFAAAVLRSLPPATKRRLREALRKLAQDPTGTELALDVRALEVPRAAAPLMRLRVGEWRVAYLVKERGFLVLRIFHRRDGYGWMERTGRRP